MEEAVTIHFKIQSWEYVPVRTEENQENLGQGSQDPAGIHTDCHDKQH
jgi:hypothetical protein